MNSTRKVKGPWTLRFLALLFTVLVGLLVFWLLGFALRDIGSLPPPSFEAVEQRHLDRSASEKKSDLERQVAVLKRRISAQQERQRLLRDSINSAQTTLNQMLDIQRLSLQKGLAPTEAQQKAFSESQDLFLANQQRYQSLNDELTRWSEELLGLEENLRQVDESLNRQRAQAQEEYARIRRGPLKFMIWNRQSIRKFNVPPAPAPAADEAYSCPACGARVYEACAACKAIRHSYLPACEHCGAEKEWAPPTTAEPAAG